MRKSKIILLFAFVLAIIMLLSSCGVSNAKFKRTYNNDYKVETKEVLTSYKKISDVEIVSDRSESDDSSPFYTAGSFSYSNYDIFTYFSNSSYTTHKVVSSVTGDIVFSASDSDSVKHLVIFPSSTKTFVVVKATRNGDGDYGYAYTLYDTFGNALDTAYSPVYNNNLLPVDYSGNFVVFNNVAYEYNEDDYRLIKVTDISSYTYIPDEYSFKTDEYYYEISSSSSSLKKVAVYDRTFAVTAIWYAPSYANNLSSMVLNSGDVLIQYQRALPEDADEYDFFVLNGSNTKKYDLVSLRLDAEDGDTTELDLEFVIYSGTSRATHKKLYETLDKDIDNIVYAFDIDNERLDTSIGNLKIYSLTKKGRADKLLNSLTGQIGLAEKIADNRYCISVENGLIITNEKGKVLKTLASSINIKVAGQYIISSEAIYDLDFNVVQSMKSTNDKTFSYKVYGESVFVTVTKSNGSYEVIMYNGGNTKTIYTSSNNTNFYFYEYAGIYEIFTSSAGNVKYEYYNSIGNKLFETSYSLSIAHAWTDDMHTVILSGTENAKPVYYIVH